jgi:hypothetical protein
VEVAAARDLRISPLCGRFHLPTVATEVRARGRRRYSALGALGLAEIVVLREFRRIRL